MDFSNKNILVCGMAQSGVAAAKLIKSHNGNVVLQDKKDASELKEVISSLSGSGINILTGENPETTEGFDFIVLSPGVPADLPFLKAAEEKGIPVISEIELGYLFCKAPIAAITGTNGKTTTTALLGEILKSYNPKTFVVGNIGNAISNEAERMDEGSFCVCELSSFQLEKIKDFRPHVSAVLNITPDHLDRHKTMENYINIKERIFLNQNKDDYLILNYEDEVCRKMAEKTSAKVFFFSSKRSLSEGIFLKNDIICINALGSKEEVINVDELKIFGVHNYENAMAASMMAACMGVPLKCIGEVLKNFKAVEHRIEFVKTIKGVDFFNDSKGTNPDSSIKAIQAMKKPTVLIGGGYDKNADYTEWIQNFSGKIKELVLIGETADKIEKACKEQGFYNITRAKTLEEAVDISFSKAEEGEAILLSPACASWGMFDNYEQRGRLFKEYALSLSN